MEAGDFILVQGNAWYSRLIRLGQRFRFRGSDGDFAKWSHAALILNSEGDLAEALGDGVVRTSLLHYDPNQTPYRVVRVLANEEDRKQIVDFAESVLAARWKYGWRTIAAIIFTTATGSKYVIGKVGTAICSGFVAEALVRAGYIWDRPPAYMTPADLAFHFTIHA